MSNMAQNDRPLQCGRDLGCPHRAADSTCPLLLLPLCGCLLTEIFIKNLMQESLDTTVMTFVSESLRTSKFTFPSGLNSKNQA